MPGEDQDIVLNYAAAFIDLLGQKDALKGCTLVPHEQTEASRNEFLSMFKASIGAIKRLHEACDELFNISMSFRSESVRNLPPEALLEYEKITKTNLKYQRFSDGLVAYVSLGDPEVPVPLNGIFGLIISCGGLCLLGLAMEEPLRIGLEVAWGVELKNNELYGCVLAKSHELESKVAGHPRVVVGDQLVEYLKFFSNADETVPYSFHSKKMAQHCLEMITMDYDGYYIVDYLGLGFKKYASTSLDETLYEKAFLFVSEQLKKWRDTRRSDLASRYKLLTSYFELNRDNWIKST